MGILFHDFKVILKSFSPLAARFVGVVAVIFLVLVFVRFLQGGQLEVIKYITEVDYLRLMSVVLVFAVLLPFFISISLGGIRFITALRYCKKNGCMLRDFFKKPKQEILEIWDQWGRH